MFAKISYFLAVALVILAFGANGYAGHSTGGAYIPKQFTTQSGISGLFLADHNLPMVTIQYSFPHAGAISDPPQMPGRAYFASMMLMEGAGGYDAAEFREKLESHAIKLSARVNEDTLTINIQTLTRYLPEAIHLAGLMLTKPRFDKTAIERVRKQLLTNIANLHENPNWLANYEWNKLAYANHAYATPIEGEPDSINNISVQDIKNWHKNMLSKENILVSVVGDTEIEQLTTLLEQSLSLLPDKLQMKNQISTPKIALKGRPVVVNKDVPQTVVLFGLPAVERSHPDFYATYVMNHILGGGGLTSRLSNILRQEYGFAYSANSYLAVSLFGTALKGRFATRNNQAVLAVELLQNILHNFKLNGASAEEVANAKQYIIGSFPLAVDSQYSRVNYLAAMQLYDLGIDYLQKRNDYFAAVTVEDVKRVANNLLFAKPLTVMVGQPAGDINWNDYAIPTTD